MRVYKDVTIVHTYKHKQTKQEIYTTKTIGNILLRACYLGQSLVRSDGCANRRRFTVSMAMPVVMAELWCGIVCA